ncbi:hypothetical protein B9G98_01748 [Wickerhamiella sorbophila]|uniref:Uncharacterized protein n=1 Tax=Wickerhamiella sorbophila TaxID=45607 RepID=A0A2T0FGK9_9ASCO|nr:hypothetical protein B9G98_01748 [Wickerhamiella sorbophila]PRT54128.1 hypothetical protein B9G98_01748 [Wickerhamiella sorbophila]
MLSFIKRVSGLSHQPAPAAIQPSVDPTQLNLVVSQSDDCEDGYAQVSVRPMTYAEVASRNSVRSWVKPVRTLRPVEPRVAQEVSASTPRNIHAESDDLYGDLAERVYHPPRKGYKRSRQRAYV